MISMHALWIALAAALAFGLAGWLVSLAKRDVSIVDSMWSLMFVFSAGAYVSQTGQTGPRTLLVMSLLLVWALRLAIHISWRNWGEEEDYRYQQIRKNNSPHFALKSLYIVFGLQAVLAWFVSMPALAALGSTSELGLLDALGAAVWLTGFFFESVGDFQLARFKGDPANQGKVMRTGLWRFTRHPNYFGDFCVWWGFYLIAVSAGAWWTLLSPLLMSFLLLKVSGVAMLEKTITQRRPKYADYIASTNAFFPGPSKGSGH
jgi:steroid 5-alpha reductase family enzyme